MNFRGMLRRVAGAGAVLAAVGAMLIAPVSATAAPAAQGEVGTTAIYTIKHPNSGNCLEATPELAVRLWPCDGSLEQQWNNYALGRFKNNRWLPNPGMCLASNGESVFLMECGTRSSTWTTTATNPKLLGHAVETSMCLTTKSSVAERFAYMIDCREATRWVFS